MDKIIIEELEIYAYHGVMYEEKILGQMFIVSAEINADLEAAAVNDDISRTINYAELCADIEYALTFHKYDLIEAAALSVIKRIFDKYPLVASVRILLKKPSAPLGRHLKYAAVELERKRDDKHA